MRSVIRRLRAFLRRHRLDDELAEEILTHIELRRRALIEQGWSAREVAVEARRQFGSVAAVREQSRDHWSSPLLSAFAQDVRFGARMILGAALYGVSPLDPTAFTGAVGFLAATAVGAAWLPARRAAAVDSLLALRSD